jgi:hypothetical protein
MTRSRILLAALAASIGSAAWLSGSAALADAAAVSGNRPSLTQGWPIVTGWQPPTPHQVRIEQHFSIRITPGNGAMPPAVIEEWQQVTRPVRMVERKIGKCLAIGSIAAVRAGDGNNLLLLLRDQRMVAALLEKRCSGRDFYSGFYVQHNADNAICIGRDILQSRSGANCKLRGLHELVPAGYRRFP